MGIRPSGERKFGSMSPMKYESEYCSSLYEDFLFDFEDLEIYKSLGIPFNAWLDQEYYVIVRQIQTLTRARYIKSERQMWEHVNGDLKGYPFDTEYTRSMSSTAVEATKKDR